MTQNQPATDSPRDWVAEHTQRYVETNGEEGHLWRGAPTLILTVKGRRSGQWRRTALIYGQDGDRYLLVASRGGADEHPQWYLNLDADSEVQVQVLGDKFAARAMNRLAGREATTLADHGRRLARLRRVPGQDQPRHSAHHPGARLSVQGKGRQGPGALCSVGIAWRLGSWAHRQALPLNFLLTWMHRLPHLFHTIT